MTSQDFGFGVSVREAEGAEGVFILHMKANENRFNPDFMVAIDRALSHVEKHEGPTALVTVGEGKFYSNGLDLDYVGSHTDQVESFMNQYMALLAHFLIAGVPTVAAVNGHCFAGGFLLALSHDYRIMREDRGFCCLNEVDIGLNLCPGMAAVARAKLERTIFRDSILNATRYTAPEGVKAGFIDDAVPDAEVLSRAVALAQKLAPRGANKTILSQLKQEMYIDAYDKLTKGGLGLAAGKFGGSKKKKANL